MTAPKRPPGLAHGRWLGDFPELSEAEMALVAACAQGEDWKPECWDGKRPEAATPANIVRAGLIRFLVLGGDAEHPVHEVGVMLCGVWITEELNLEHAVANAPLDARSCVFAEVPIFQQASLPRLVLRGSLCPGLKADGLRVINGLFLDVGFHAIGEVRLLGAEIDVQLSCNGGRFDNEGGVALSADSMTVNGPMFLELASVVGSINLMATRVKTLADGVDFSCWQGGMHFLDGFQYDRIIGFTDVARRIEWLKTQHVYHLTTGFCPQPWEQLIKVLREMGHPTDASAVAVAKQEQMRVAGVIRGKLRRPLHWLYGLLAGYGHRPLRAVGAMAAVWFLCSLAFWVAADRYAAIGPANPAITSGTLYPDAEKLCGHGNEAGKARWTECSGVPDEYSTFQPFIYSLDLILPLVDLQQERDWAPIAEGPTGVDLLPGALARWLMWFEILFGWGMSLMLVAVLGRLVDKD